MSPEQKARLYEEADKIEKAQNAAQHTAQHTPSHIDDIPRAEQPSVSERSFTNSEPAPVKFNHQDEINPVGDVLDDMKNWDNLSDAEKRSFQDKFNALSPQQKARLYEEVDKIEQAKNATSHIDDISGAEQPRVYDERPVTKAEPDSVTDFNYNRSSVNGVDDVPNYDYAPRAQGSGGRMIFDDSVLVDGKVPQELIDREIRARGLKDGTIEIYSETQFKEKLARNMMDAPDIPATVERSVVHTDFKEIDDLEDYYKGLSDVEYRHDGAYKVDYEVKLNPDGSHYVEKISTKLDAPPSEDAMRLKLPDDPDGVPDFEYKNRPFTPTENTPPSPEHVHFDNPYQPNEIENAGIIKIQPDDISSHVDDFSGAEQPRVYDERPVTKAEPDSVPDFDYNNRSSVNGIDDEVPTFKYENKSSTPIEDVSSPHEPVRATEKPYEIPDDEVPRFEYENKPSSPIEDVSSPHEPVRATEKPYEIPDDEVPRFEYENKPSSPIEDVSSPHEPMQDNVTSVDNTSSVVNNVDDIPPSEIHHEIEKPNITDDFADEITTSKPVAEEMPSVNNPVNETPHSQVTDDFLDDASLTPHDSVTPDRPSSSVSSPAEEFADTLEDAVPENVHDGNLKKGNEFLDDELERAVPDKEYRANDDLFPDDPSNSVHPSANIDVDNHSASPLQTHATDTSNTLDDALFPDEDVAPIKSHADVDNPMGVKNPSEGEQALPSDVLGETSHYNNDYVPLKDVTEGKSVPETVVNENGATLRYNGHTQKYEGVYQGEKVEVQVDDVLKNKDYVPDEFTNDKGIKIVKQGTNNYSAVDVKTNRVVDEFPWSKAKEEYDALAKTNRAAPDTFRHEASGDTFVLDKNDNSYLRHHNGEIVDRISSYDAERLYNAQFPNQAPDHFFEPERGVAYNLMEDGRYFEVTFPDGRTQTVPTDQIDTYFNENPRLFETNLDDPDKYIDHNYINAEIERKKAEIEEYLAKGGLPLVF